MIDGPFFQEDDLGGNSLKAQASRSRAAALGTPIRLNRDLLSGKDPLSAALPRRIVA
jgi:hypothetical protein